MRVERRQRVGGREGGREGGMAGSHRSCLRCPRAGAALPRPLCKQSSSGAAAPQSRGENKSELMQDAQLGPGGTDGP